MVLDSSLAALPGSWPAIASVCSLLAKGLHPQVSLTAGAQRTGPAKFAKTLCSEPVSVKKVAITSRCLAPFPARAASITRLPSTSRFPKELFSLSSV